MHGSRPARRTAALSGLLGALIGTACLRPPPYVVRDLPPPPMPACETQPAVEPQDEPDEPAVMRSDPADIRRRSQDADS